MKATARQRVLDYLMRRPGASPAQIGSALRLSSPSVRHHLRILQAEGRVVSAAAIRRAGGGRPAVTYRPSDRLLGDNLGLIADSLLRAWPRGGAVRRQQMIAALADGLLRELGPAPSTGNLPSRLSALVTALNRAHYRARWEAGAEGPRVVFGHCPYAAIIDDHPELCQMDQAALADYMPADVAQLAKIDGRSHSVNQCVFALRRAGSAPVEY